MKLLTVLTCLLVCPLAFCADLDPNLPAPAPWPVQQVEWRAALAEIKVPVANLEARANREASLLHGTAEVAAEGLVDRIAGNDNYQLQALQPFVAAIGSSATLSTFVDTQRNQAVRQNGTLVNQPQPLRVGYSIVLTPNLQPGTPEGVVMSEVVVAQTLADGNAVHQANAYNKTGLREGDFQTLVWTTGSRQFLLVLRRKGVSF
ncbi:hypothetical protein ACVW0Y_001059 [Pseudomonas sp. TE3786]